MKEIDVLIVGAGPTGLMMAIELTRHGLNCRIIDKNPLPSIASKAIVIQPRTLEVFHHIGIVDRFIAVGLKVHAINPISNERLIAHLNLAQLSSSFPFILSLEQSKTEQILSEYLVQLGVQIERNVELLSFEPSPDQVNVVLRDHTRDMEERLSIPWLMGCDGAHSIVRKTLDLTFKGKLFSDVFSLADVRVKWNNPSDEVFAFPNAEGVMAAIPLPEKERYRLIFQLKRCRDALKKRDPKDPSQQFVSGPIPNPTMDEIQTVLRSFAGPNAIASEPLWIANFNINSRMADSYRKERIFLAGDAAHIHSPIGGQGMNTGLQDAYNLAWKLALVHSKKAYPELLDSYHLERHTIGKKLLKGTELASRFATLHQPLLVAIRNWMMSHFLRIPGIQKYFLTTLAQLSICYPPSKICKKANSFHKGIQAGLRAPNAHIMYQNVKTDLYSLFGKTTHFHLLLFSGPNCCPATLSSLIGLAKRLEEHYPVKAFCIISNAEKNDLSCPFVIDHSKEAHPAYKANAPSAYIIRPDTYIGYSQMNLDESPLLNYFQNLYI